MYRIATSSFLFKRLIENYIRLVRYSVLSVAFIADHICLRQRIKQFHASSSEPGLNVCLIPYLLYRQCKTKFSTLLSCRLVPCEQRPFDLPR